MGCCVSAKTNRANRPRDAVGIDPRLEDALDGSNSFIMHVDGYVTSTSTSSSTTDPKEDKKGKTTSVTKRGQTSRKASAGQPLQADQHEHRLSIGPFTDIHSVGGDEDEDEGLPTASIPSPQRRRIRFWDNVIDAQLPPVSDKLFGRLRLLSWLDGISDGGGLLPLPPGVDAYNDVYGDILTRYSIEIAGGRPLSQTQSSGGESVGSHGGCFGAGQHDWAGMEENGNDGKRQQIIGSPSGEGGGSAGLQSLPLTSSSAEAAARGSPTSPRAPRDTSIIDAARAVGSNHQPLGGLSLKEDRLQALHLQLRSAEYKFLAAQLRLFNRAMKQEMRMANLGAFPGSGVNSSGSFHSSSRRVSSGLSIHSGSNTSSGAFQQPGSSPAGSRQDGYSSPSRHSSHGKLHAHQRLSSTPSVTMLEHGLHDAVLLAARGMKCGEIVVTSLLFSRPFVDDCDANGTTDETTAASSPLVDASLARSTAMAHDGSPSEVNPVQFLSLVRILQEVAVRCSNLGSAHSSSSYSGFGGGLGSHVYNSSFRLSHQPTHSSMHHGPGSAFGAGGSMHLGNPLLVARPRGDFVEKR